MAWSVPSWPDRQLLSGKLPSFYQTKAGTKEKETLAWGNSSRTFSLRPNVPERILRSPDGLAHALCSSTLTLDEGSVIENITFIDAALKPLSVFCNRPDI